MTIPSYLKIFPYFDYVQIKVEYSTLCTDGVIASKLETTQSWQFSSGEWKIHVWKLQWKSLRADTNFLHNATLVSFVSICLNTQDVCEIISSCLNRSFLILWFPCGRLAVRPLFIGLVLCKITRIQIEYITTDLNSHENRA